MQNSSKIRQIQRATRKALYLFFFKKKKKWKSFLVYPSFKRRTLSISISKFVIRLVRRYDQEERDTDGAVHWNTISPKLMREFGNQGARDFSEVNWLQHISAGSNWTRFEHCGEFQKHFDVHPCNSRTHWWEHDSA